jgi:predicted MFS family arabinose efflux permease
MVPPEQVNNAVSLNSALMTSSRIVGPALAGLLSATVGYGWCFALDGATYLAVIAGLWMINSAETEDVPVTPRAKGQVRAGLRYVKELPELWIPLGVMGIVGMLSFNFPVVMPLLVKHTFGGNDGTFTLLYSVVAVGSLVGALATARRKSIEVKHVVAASALFGGAMLLLAAAPNLALSFVFGLVMGATSIAFMTASTAIVQVRATPEMRGRVLALQAILFLGSTPIGGPLLGAICDQWGPRSGLLLGGVAALAAAAWAVAAYRRASARSASKCDEALGRPAAAAASSV